MHNLADLYIQNPLLACQLALRRTVNSSNRIETINNLLGLHGTEAIRGDWQNGYWCDIVAVYCNTGDTYALTVIEVRDWRGGSNFRVSSFGDFVERNQSRLGII